MSKVVADQILRKAKTEALLQKEGIPFLPSLPCIESELEIKLRSAEEIGIRILCLFCVSGSAFEREDSAFKDYLKEHDLWEHLTPDEVSFLSDSVPDPQTISNFTWRCEALFLLMWAVHLFEELPLPFSETDTGEIVSKLPSVGINPWPFIQSLQLRGTSEFLDASDLIYRLHWATRNAQLQGENPPADLIPGVVQEWHHAINWVTRYENLEWDEITTDT
jgi:hypothetical protein